MYDKIAQNLNISSCARLESDSGGESRFEKHIRFVRQGLKDNGYLTSERYGVWSLTEKGRSAGILTIDQVNEVVRAARSGPRKILSADDLDV